ncbi:MAG: hypothetical protein CMH54_05555 [Myxococcales bacterium]|nr:hypothetical protein [Myxococcales bacterium]
MSDIEMATGEETLGEWTLNYVPPVGGRYTGKLQVTNHRLLFDAQFDTSVSGTLGELLVTGGGPHGYLSIPRSAISRVDVKTSFFKKKVVVMVGEQQAHTFDYGMLSVKKIAAAIQG